MDNYVWVLTETDGTVQYKTKVFTTEKAAQNRMCKEYEWDLEDTPEDEIVEANCDSDRASIIFQDDTMIEYRIRCVKIDEFAE